MQKAKKHGFYMSIANVFLKSAVKSAKIEHEAAV